MDKASTFLAQPFTLTNFDDTGVLGWQWVLRDKPAGSSATITGANTATASITPDIAGTYLIQLLTYTDAATTLFDDADEQAIGIRYAGTEDYRIPAAGETTQFSTGRGWANEVNEILIDIRSKLGSGGGTSQVKVTAADTTESYLDSKVAVVAPLVKTTLNPAANEQLQISTTLVKSYLAGVTNELVTTLGSEVLIGGFVFDGSLAFASRVLRAYGTVVSAVANVDVRLYDMGPPGTPAAGILRSTVNLATLNVPLTGTKTLTVSGAPGVNADAIFNTARMYEVRAIVNASAPGDEFKASWVGLELA